MIRQRFVDFHDGFEAQNRLRGRRTLAAAVRMNTDIGRQHRSKRFHIAVARRDEKSLGKLKATLFVNLEARSRLADMEARPGSELTTGSGVTSNGGADFLESQPEHIVKQEGRALERGKTFERKHQRQGDVLFALLFDDGVGKPRADIGLALASR